MKHVMENDMTKVSTKISFTVTTNLLSAKITSAVTASDGSISTGKQLAQTLSKK
jgi:hypothetical protein